MCPKNIICGIVIILIIGLGLFAVSLGGCAQGVKSIPVPTIHPSPTVTATPTASISPSATPTATGSARRSPTPTSTSMPTATPTLSKWTNISSGSGSKNLNALCFVDTQEGWLVGDHGTIIHTNNGGSNWSTQDSGTTETLISVSFASHNVGWAIGLYSIFRTTDEGNNWQKWIMPGPGNPKYDVFAVDELSLWLGGDVFLQHSPDKGVTWNLFGNVPGVEIRSIYLRGQKGWAAGYKGTVAHIYSTHSGGSDYWNANVATWESKQLNEIMFADDNVGYAVGGSGFILKSIDGGTTWNTQTISTTNNLTGLAVVDSLEAWASSPNLSGKILHTFDGGITWNQESVPISPINAVFFVDPSHGWAVGGSGQVMKYID